MDQMKAASEQFANVLKQRDDHIIAMGQQMKAFQDQSAAQLQQQATDAFSSRFVYALFSEVSFSCTFAVRGVGAPRMGY